MNKETAVQGMERLVEYFDELPAEKIDQSNGNILSHDGCGCFGAHVAFALLPNCKQCEAEGVIAWHYGDGSGIFNDIIRALTDGNRTCIDILERRQGIRNPFGSGDWPRPHREVVRDIYNDLIGSGQEQEGIPVDWPVHESVSVLA